MLPTSVCLLELCLWAVPGAYRMPHLHFDFDFGSRAIIRHRPGGREVPWVKWMGWRGWHNAADSQLQVAPSQARLCSVVGQRPVELRRGVYNAVPGT